MVDGTGASVARQNRNRPGISPSQNAGRPMKIGRPPECATPDLDEVNCLSAVRAYCHWRRRRPTPAPQPYDRTEATEVGSCVSAWDRQQHQSSGRRSDRVRPQAARRSENLNVGCRPETCHFPTTGCVRSPGLPSYSHNVSRPCEPIVHRPNPGLPLPLGYATFLEPPLAKQNTLSKTVRDLCIREQCASLH
jgi:hypothetical protein